MPIRECQKARYPADWKAISLRIRERAEWRCEGSPAYPECRAENGEPHPVTGSRVVLTVAHLGFPPQLPLFFHMTRDAVTDEIFEAVCFLMPLNAEVPEWHHMMHNRAAAEFLRGTETGGARFFIALPRGASRFAPTLPVVFRPFPASPIWVRLTRWCLLRKPSKAAAVPAKSPSGVDVPPAYAEAFAAALACGIPQASLASADCFFVAGARTGAAVVGSLLRGEAKRLIADDALTGSGAFPRSGHAALYHMDDYPENCAHDNLRAWCQRCHLTYDAAHHAANAAATRRAQKAIGDLFEQASK